MALSSDELIKREIIDEVGFDFKNLKIRIFPESSDDDQKSFTKGGLTFGHNGLQYGSCDAAWLIPNKEFEDNLTKDKYDEFPVVALEGTDAIRRGSSGNAQYQRFHHALGAVKNGVIGIYYLKKGSQRVQPDLYGMAYNVSRVEKGTYIITQDLKVVKRILELIDNYGENSKQVNEYLLSILEEMKQIYSESFEKKYKGSWETFAKKRSTLFKQDDIVIKYAGRNIRNFTESSQRAGHIAVGEMYLTKYFFPEKKFYYLFPRMTSEDIKFLNKSKKADKEWTIISNEENVYIKGMDDLKGLPQSLRDVFMEVRMEPLKKEANKKYKDAVKQLVELIDKDDVTII